MKYQARESTPSTTTTRRRTPATAIPTRRQTSRREPAVTTRSRQKGPRFEKGIRVVSACTINKSVEECYTFFRQFKNLPSFMKHLVDVKDFGSGNSHWVAHGPAGKYVEWDAIISEDKPNELISWHTVEESDLQHAGSIYFRPGPPHRGTEVCVSLEYDPPAGKLGKMFAMIFGEEPGQQIGDDLKRFKSLMECGEIISTEGQPTGRTHKR